MRKVIQKQLFPDLDLPGSPIDYIIPCHPTGEETQPHNAPSYYLIDQYLKHNAKSLFPSALENNANYPVMIAGKYQNLTKDIPVSKKV